MKSAIRIPMILLALLFGVAQAHADNYSEAIEVSSRPAKAAASSRKATVTRCFRPSARAASASRRHARAKCTNRNLRRRRHDESADGRLQLGGQAYSQIIFFETSALRRIHWRQLRVRRAGQCRGDHRGRIRLCLHGRQLRRRQRRPARRLDGGRGGYHKGMAVFTVAKGGLMYEARSAARSSPTRPRNSSPLRPGAPRFAG